MPAETIKIITHLFDGHRFTLGSELKPLRTIFSPKNCSELCFSVAFLLKNRQEENIFVSVLSDEVLVKFTEEIFIIPGTFFNYSESSLVRNERGYDK